MFSYELENAGRHNGGSPRSPTCSPGSGSLIVTTIRMMDLEALLQVQMGLLHPLVDGPHF
jgi:hypothetical protein